MDGEQHQHLVALRQTHLRRLQELEKQAAFFGANVRPEVLTEIAEIRVHIQLLEQQLGIASPRSLRDPVADFVGRHREVEQILNALRPRIATGTTAALYAIRGLGGVGKTELAYVVAQRLTDLFPDGELLLELQNDPQHILMPVEAIQRVIRAFDRSAQLPDNLTELQGIYRALLAGRRVLILADDATGAAQVRPLIPPTGCGLLLTSRHRFTLPGMLALDLGMLPPDDAAALLLSICPRLGTHAPRLANLCGCLPVALRVSASLLANDDTIRVAHYLAQLSDLRTKLALLRDPGDTSLDVEATLALSYDDLEPYAQEVFCQLTVFPTSFDAVAAETVVAPSMPTAEATIEATLGLLRRRNLVDWDERAARYSLHDLVRAFAATRLVGMDETELRHSRYYAGVAAQIGALYHDGSGSAQQEALTRFDQERAHIDTGWAWARSHAGHSDADRLLIDYAAALCYVGDLRYDARRERVPQYQAMRDAAIRLAEPRAEAIALIVLGGAHRHVGELDQAIQCHTAALELSRQHGDSAGEEEALANLGRDYYTVGMTRQAINVYEQRLLLARSLGQRRVEAYTLHDLGIAYADIGDTHVALDFFAQALAVAQQSHDAYMQNVVQRQIAVTYDETSGSPRGAEAFFEQQLALAQSLGNRREESYVLGDLGNVYLQLGEAARALACFQQRLELVQALGDRRAEGYTLDQLGRAHARLGDQQRARDHYLKALEIGHDIGNQRGVCYALSHLADSYAEEGQLQLAIDTDRQALALAKQIGNRRMLAQLSKALSGLLETHGDLAGAIAMLEVSVDYQQSITHRDADSDAAHLEQLRLRMNHTATEP